MCEKEESFSSREQSWAWFFCFLKLGNHNLQKRFCQYYVYLANITTMFHSSTCWKQYRCIAQPLDKNEVSGMNWNFILEVSFLCWPPHFVFLVWGDYLNNELNLVWKAFSCCWHLSSRRAWSITTRESLFVSLCLIIVIVFARMYSCLSLKRVLVQILPKPLHCRAPHPPSQ